jgi:hypothetical protein
MDLGHGFLPRIDARNYKAVERRLPRDGPGLFNVGLDLPSAILEGPWALQHGASTIELCRDRGISFLIDTQAWRYRDSRTFFVEKFMATPYAPPAPSARSDKLALSRFVEADLKTPGILGRLRLPASWPGRRSQGPPWCRSPNHRCGDRAAGAAPEHRTCHHRQLGRSRSRPHLNCLPRQPPRRRPLPQGGFLGGCVIQRRSENESGTAITANRQCRDNPAGHDGCHTGVVFWLNTDTDRNPRAVDEIRRD